MIEPYLIEGPASINMSGGKTSAFMARQIQLAGSLKDPSVEVIFADTGKEREETYQFIEQLQRVFEMAVVWVAYGYEPTSQRRIFEEGKTPFELMIKHEKYMPNPVQRICTDRLKIKQIHKYMKGKYGRACDKVIGIRADEPRRVAKLRKAPDAHHIFMPLHVAGIDKRAVLSFWKAQPFDLQLREWEGNCDLCFLKGAAKKKAIMRDRPDLAAWWIRIERENGHRFRAHGKNYLALLEQAIAEAKQLNLIEDPEEEEGLDDLGDCLCGD